MFRYGRVCLAAAKGISSAEFTSDDGDGSRAAREFTRAQHTSNAAGAAASRPSIETYRAMSNEELETLLRVREDQVQRLRAVYETFHYETDKLFRTMIFDYHDKALQLSQVHGKMQLGSLQISREALVKMRQEQEMFGRDHRIVVAVCTLGTFVFWVWVRRHYVRRSELEADETDLLSMGSGAARSVTGAGSYNENPFGSAKRNARNRETSWERETREQRKEKI